MIKLLFIIAYLPIAYADLIDELPEESIKTESKKQKQPPKNIEKKVIPKKQPPKKHTAKKQTVKIEPKKPQKQKPKIEKNTKKNSKKEKTLAWDKKAPLKFQGNTLSGIRAKGSLELKSQVKIKQGNLTLEAEQAKLIFNPKNDEVEKVLASGGVKILRSSTEQDQILRANSRELSYNVNKQEIILDGNAILMRGKDTIKGQRIRYFVASGHVIAEKVEGLVKIPKKN